MSTNTAIKTWHERQLELSAKEFGNSEIRMRDAEIAELRAALEAAQSAAQHDDGEVETFEVWWGAERLSNGADIGADYRHWAMKGYAFAIAQRAGSDLEAPTVREFQNLDRGKLYDICCHQSHAIKEAEKCIKRYQYELSKATASALIIATAKPQPDSERDAARYHGICQLADRVNFDLSASQEEIDAEVDAAMAAQHGEKGGS